MKSRRRNIRFYSKPIGISLLDENDLEIFEGETDGINNNGCGAHIKRYHSYYDIDNDKLNGQTFKIVFHVPSTILKPTFGKIIRVEPTHEPGYQKFVAIAFTPTIDIKNLWKTVI